MALMSRTSGWAMVPWAVAQEEPCCSPRCRAALARDYRSTAWRMVKRDPWPRFGLPAHRAFPSVRESGLWGPIALHQGKVS
jgi:hypothetical protein